MNTEKVIEEKVIELGKVSEETKGMFGHGESLDLTKGPSLEFHDVLCG